MNEETVMAALSELGSDSIKKTLLRHGAREPFFGVKVADLKVLQKKIKHDHDLALSLYDTGNSDAMYFAGLISEPQKMTRENLDKWAADATWSMISEYTVAWVAAESGIGWETALLWIDSKLESVASSGWATLSGIVALLPDAQLDLAKIEELIMRVEREIHTAPNRVRSTMNNFIIAVGCYVAPMLEITKQAAARIGAVEINVGDSACKVPSALAYIEKVEKAGKAGKKKKTVFC
jgi:3-methyladenine DNA glycosylase AlkD